MATTTTFLPPSATTAAPTESCTTAVPDKYGYVPFDACNSNYLAPPDFAANLAFAVLFGTTTLVHFVEAAAFKMVFCWVLLMGGVWETVAFTLKTLGSHRQQVESYAIIGQLLFLLSPLWINAFVYMVGARMVYFGLPDKKIWGIPAIKLTVLFVWLDVTCFIVQLAGGAMLSSSDPKIASIAMKIYTAGVSLQLGFVTIFIVMMGSFYRLMYKTTRGQIGPLQFLIWAVLAVLGLIVVRVVFRLVEFGSGFNADNKLITDETYPLVLDAFPMVFAFVILNVIHPGFILHGPNSNFPKISRRERKEMKRRQKEERRMKKEDRKYNKKHRRGAGSDSFALVDSNGYGRAASISDEESGLPIPRPPFPPRQG